jgi:hypothetical protein
MSSNHRGCIYRAGGQNLKFLEFFSDFFGAMMVKKTASFFSSTSQIRIQTVKFQFKRTNHEPPCHYRPPAPATGSSASGTARPGRRQPCHPVPLPRRLGRAVVPDHRAIAPSGRALPSATGISLNCFLANPNRDETFQSMYGILLLIICSKLFLDAVMY